MNTNIKKVFFLSVLSILLSACVLKAKHDETAEKAVLLDADLKATSSELEKSQKELKELKKEFSKLETRNEELSQTNQILSGRNREFSDQSLETQKELLRLKEEKAKAEERIRFVTKTHDDLVHTLKREIEAGQVLIAQQGDRVTVNVANQVLFPSGSDQVQMSGKKSFDQSCICT